MVLSSFSQSIPDLASILDFIFGLKRPVVSWIGSDYIWMLVGLLGINLRLLTHGSGTCVVILRKNNISFPGGLLLFWIGSSHYILKLLIRYFPVNSLILLETFVHSLYESIVLSIIMLRERFVLQFWFRIRFLPSIRVRTRVCEIYRFVFDLLSFSFGSQIIGLGTFLCVGGWGYFDQIWRFQWVIWYKECITSRLALVGLDGEFVELFAPGICFADTTTTQEPLHK